MNITGLTPEQFIDKYVDAVATDKRSSIEQKIQGLIIVRRDHHGNEYIQNKCNTYLTKLYDEKYENIRRAVVC